MGIRREHLVKRGEKIFRRREHQVKIPTKTASFSDVNKGRQVGAALQGFNDTQGWVPHKGDTDASAVIRTSSNKSRQAGLHDVHGENETMTINGSTVNVPGLKKVVAAFPIKSQNKHQLEVTYVDASNTTYREMFHEENGQYVPTWPADNNGQRQKGFVHQKPIKQAAPLFQTDTSKMSGKTSSYEGFAGIDEDGALVFKETRTPRGKALSEAFEKELKDKGRVVSMDTTSDGIIVLQESPTGEKTLSSLRTWNTDHREGQEKYSTFTQSTAIDPSITEVAFEPTSKESLPSDNNVTLIRQDKKVTKVSLTQIESNAKKYSNSYP